MIRYNHARKDMLSGITTLQICRFFSEIMWTLGEVPTDRELFADAYWILHFATFSSVEYLYGNSTEKVSHL